MSTLKVFFITNCLFTVQNFGQNSKLRQRQNLPTPFSKHMEMLDEIFLKIDFQFLVEFGSKKGNSPGVRHEGINL